MNRLKNTKDLIDAIPKTLRGPLYKLILMKFEKMSDKLQDEILMLMSDSELQEYIYHEYSKKGWKKDPKEDEELQELTKKYRKTTKKFLMFILDFKKLIVEYQKL